MAVLQTNGKFACPVCGPQMRSHRSRSLRKEVFDEYKHFLSKKHSYQTNEKYIFNGKEETRLKPRRMTPGLWMKQYKGYSNCNLMWTKLSFNHYIHEMF